MANNPVHWFEIYVQDIERAKAFYEAVLGVTMDSISPPDEELSMYSFPMSTDNFGSSGAIVHYEMVPSGGNSTLVYFHCDDQHEIDYYWDKLLDGGSAMACGWLKDQYGLAWQIVPAKFFELVRSEDPERAARVIAAMNTMVKFDLAALEKAAAGTAVPQFHAPWPE